MPNEGEKKRKNEQGDGRWHPCTLADVTSLAPKLIFELANLVYPTNAFLLYY